MVTIERKTEDPAAAKDGACFLMSACEMSGLGPSSADLYMAEGP